MARLVCMYGADNGDTLDPRVRAALERYAPEAGLETEWVDTSGSLQVYADEMEKRWLGTEDLILVEQDKEVHASCFPSMMACGELWCGYTFWVNPEPHTALAIGGFGVVKFSAAVQRMIPVAEFRGKWQHNIDRRFHLCLEKRGHGCHLHGHVIHHHVYEPRPERVRRHAALLRERGLLPPAVNPRADDPGLLPGSYRLEV